MYSNYRDGQAWRKLALPMTTGSDEACKMYDAALTQIMSYHDDENLGGIEGTLTKMKEADPKFVMGSVMLNYFDLSAKYVSGDEGLSDGVNQMISLAEKTSGLTHREKLHVRAIVMMAHGDKAATVKTWEDILLSYPCDGFAIFTTFFSYLNSGKFVEMRDSLARILPYWKPAMPHYGYLQGLKAFSLEETNMFPQAEAAAREALSINPKDAWSTHALCHTLQSTGRHKEIFDLYEKTEDNWTFGKNLACHNYWHWGLNHIEMGEYEPALSIFDTQLSKRWDATGNLFNLTDVVSMLYRLEFEGVNVGDRWYTISDKYKSHIDNRSSPFTDAHVFMACLNGGEKEEDLAGRMLESIQEFIKNGKGVLRDIAASVGETIAKALIAYKDQDYAGVVDLMQPIRYDILKIGGSNAQRDLFNLFLIQAAVRSPRKEHTKLARNLLNERKAFYGHSPMSDRLMSRLMEGHDD